MSVNSYLTQLANGAIIRDQEKVAIQRSIETLAGRLKTHFGNQIADGFVFGSYSRGTILPRGMDSMSDIDYMVIFSDSGLKPQSYLDRLRRFAEVYYSRSEIEQSNPTIVLSLNHIRFELVPAIRSWWSGLQIPAKASGYQEWMDTDPKGFNDKLTNANQTYGNLIKPLVRVIKYWNALVHYPFESYELEQKIVGHEYGFLGLITSHQLGRYFIEASEMLDCSWSAAQWKQDALSRLKQFVSQAKTFENSGNTIQAEAVIKKLLPPVGGLLGI